MLVLFMYFLTWTYIDWCYTGRQSQLKKVLVSIYFCADAEFVAWLMGWLERTGEYFFK